jgi:hypothetical protein
LDTVIIGAQRCATTTLKWRLGSHPGLAQHHGPEFAGLLFDGRYTDIQAGIRDAYPHLRPDVEHRLLAKSVRVLMDPRLQDGLAEHNADARLIVSLRDPVQRAWSAYWYARRNGWERRSFEDAVRNGPEFRDDLRRFNCDYVANGEYARQLADIDQRFARDNVKVVLAEDMRRDTVAVVQDLYAWLGLDASYVPRFEAELNPNQVSTRPLVSRLLSWSPPKALRPLARRLVSPRRVDAWKRKVRQRNQRVEAKPAMPDDVAARLREHYGPFNRELERRLGRRLAWDEPAAEAPRPAAPAQDVA